MAERTKKRISNVGNSLILFGVLVLIIGGAYYYFFHRLQTIGEKISTLSNESDSLLSEQANLTSLKTVFSDTTDERQKINSYFVQKDGAVDFITTLENLAAFAHLGHETQSVNAEEEAPPAANREWLHLTFRTNGSWQNTYYFISLLENLPYRLIIHQISTHATGQTTSEAPPSPTLDLVTGSSSPSVAPAVKKGSVWETSYDISVSKLK